MASPKVVPITRHPRNEGFYFRVRYNEHQAFARLIAEGRLSADGLIFDARHHERHESIRRDAALHSIAACLEPQGMEIALAAKLSTSQLKLPWATPALNQPDDFSSQAIERYAERLATFVVAGGYSTVLSPGHYLDAEAYEWLDVDCQLTNALRLALDSIGGTAVEIVYPLATHTRHFQDKSFRTEVVRALKSMPLDAVSLRIHPVGHESGPLAMRRFVEGCRDLRHASLPLLIERAGFMGLAVYAMGAVDRVESGVTYGDSFDVGSMLRPSAPGKKRPFALHRHVYIEAIGASIELSVANQLLSTSHGKLWFACKDRRCCPDGSISMATDPFRHSALARQRQYSELARMPASLRPNHFIFTTLGGVVDMLSRASKTHDRFKRSHHRLLSVKETLIELHRQYSPPVIRSQKRSSDQSAEIHTLVPRDPSTR